MQTIGYMLKSSICALQNGGGGKLLVQVVVLFLYPMFSVLLWLFAMVASFLYSSKEDVSKK